MQKRSPFPTSIYSLWVLPVYKSPLISFYIFQLSLKQSNDLNIMIQLSFVQRTVAKWIDLSWVDTIVDQLLAHVLPPNARCLQQRCVAVLVPEVQVGSGANQKVKQIGSVECHGIVEHGVTRIHVDWVI